MRRFIQRVVEWRRVVLVACLLVTAGLLAGAGRLSIIIDPDETLPQSHPYLVTTNLAARLFGNKYTVVIGLTPKAGDALQPAVLDTVRAITRKLAAAPGIVKANLVSLAAPKVKDIQGTADGLAARPMIEALGHAPPGAGMPPALERNPVYQGLLVSKDQRSTAIIAEFKKDAGGFRAIAARVEAIVAPYRSADLEIEVGGQPIFLGLIEKYSDRMFLLFPIALVLIGIIHFEAFRSWQGMLLPLVTGLVAVAWALGFMGWSGTPVDAFNATTPILILAVAAGHAVQILKRYYEEYRRASAVDGTDARAANERAVVESLAATGPVMIAAGATAAASFLSLTVFEIATIRTFGLFTAIGILSALVIELTLIPALRASLPPPTARQIRREAEPGLWNTLTAKLAGASIRRPGVVLLASAAFLLVMAVGAGLVRVDNSLRSYFLPSLPVRQDDATLNRRLAGNNVLLVVVKGHKADAIKSPDVLRAMAATQRFLEREPAVGRTVSIVDFIRRIDRAMNGDARDRPLPDSRDLVAQYLLLYSMAGAPGDFDAYVDYGYRNAVIRVFLKKESSAYLEGLDKRLRAFVHTHFPPGVEVAIGGNVMSPVALNEVLVKNKLINIAQIALAVFAVSALLFRSLLGGLLVLVPLATAVAANFGIMGWTGIPLQVVTATVSAMAVGIGADYAIYLLYRLREEAQWAETREDAMRRTYASAGKAVLFVASAVAVGYSVLMLSWGFLVHFWLGLLIALAMLVSAGAALTTLPALLMLLRPAFVFDGVRGTVGRQAVGSTAAMLALLLLGASAATAAAPTPTPTLTPAQIMERNFVATKVADSKAEATFVLINGDGQQRVRKTVTWTKLEDNGIDNMRLVRFLAPQDVRGTATLTVEHSAGDDDIWIYLPALRKTRRLLASNKKDSFVGTDFSYGDIIGFKPAEWRHTLLRQEACGDGRCYVVESVPATPEALETSGYAKRVQWIRTDSYVAVRGEFYGRDGRRLKTITASDLRLVDPAKNRWQPMRLEARNEETGHRTVVELENFRADQGISARAFKARELERGP